MKTNRSAFSISIQKLGLLLFSLKVSFSLSNIAYYNNEIDTIITLLACLILGIHIISRKYSVRRFSVYLVIIFLAAYTSYITGQNSFLISVITIFSVDWKDLDKCIRFLFKFQLSFLILHTMWAFIVSYYDHSILTMTINGINRGRLGFRHPNGLAIYSFNLILMYIWMIFEKIRKKQIGIIIILVAIVYYVTGSKTTLISGGMLVFLLVILTQTSSKIAEKFIVSTSSYITPVIALVVFALCLGYKKANIISLLINNFLTQRIKLGAYALDTKGISLFGQSFKELNIIWDETWKMNSFTFDCTYTYLISMMGVFWLFLIVFSFYKISKFRNTKYSLYVIIWALYAVSEVHTVNVYEFFPLIMMTLLLAPKRVVEIRRTDL